MNRKLLAVGAVIVSVAVVFSAGFYLTGGGGSDDSAPAPATIVSSAEARPPVQISQRLSKPNADAPDQSAPQGAPPTIDLGRLTNTPISIGHIPPDVQTELFTRMATALGPTHYVAVHGTAEVFFASPIPSHGELYAVYDHSTLTITLLRPGDQKKETFQNVSEDMLRYSKNFDDLIKLGAAPNGDMATEEQFQSALNSFASANGYTVLSGWAPCPPSNDLAVEVVTKDPLEQLTTMGYSQDAAKSGGDTSGGLIERVPLDGVFLVYYHRLK